MVPIALWTKSKSQQQQQRRQQQQQQQQPQPQILGVDVAQDGAEVPAATADGGASVSRGVRGSIHSLVAILLLLVVLVLVVVVLLLQ
jgi:hypothetical protein